jgi:hypothetical protein
MLRFMRVDQPGFLAAFNLERGNPTGELFQVLSALRWEGDTALASRLLTTVEARMQLAHHRWVAADSGRVTDLITSARAQFTAATTLTQRSAAADTLMSAMRILGDMSGAPMPFSFRGGRDVVPDTINNQIRDFLNEGGGGRVSSAFTDSVVPAHRAAGQVLEAQIRLLTTTSLPVEAIFAQTHAWNVAATQSVSEAAALLSVAFNRPEASVNAHRDNLRSALTDRFDLMTRYAAAFTAGNQANQDTLMSQIKDTQLRGVQAYIGMEMAQNRLVQRAGLELHSRFQAYMDNANFHRGAGDGTRRTRA